ncbi:hypothetical protein ABN763_18280 [Spongiivirga sp. MCCC 1A20706]|uniref:hypothetical protein n=1 Tax=Spongiivirga sp. MCCC 1A20706 TaxID=3160963 RepID=UPI003977649F
MIRFLLIFICLGFGNQLLANKENAELLTLYNRYSGKLKHMYLDKNGRPIGTLKESYWRTNMSTLQTERIYNYGSKGISYVLLSSRRNSKKVWIYSINKNNGNLEKQWGSDKKFTDIRLFVADGRQYFFLSEHKKGGRYAIYSPDSSSPKPDKLITKGSKWNEWTYFDFVTHDEKTYMVRYDYTDGRLIINEMRSNGKIGKQVKNTKIDKSWTSFVFYKADKKTYLMRLDRNSGRMVVNRIGKNLQFGKKIQESKLSKGWHHTAYAQKGYDDRHIIFVNRRDDRAVVRKVLDNGKLGDVTYNSKNWEKGWTHISALTHWGQEANLKSNKPQRKTGKNSGPKAKKSASLIVFYNEDKPIWQFFQTIQVQEEYAIKNYDKSILLTNKKYRAKPKPTKKDKATEANFFKYLTELADDGYYIDIYVITHGSRSGISLKKVKKDDAKNDGLVTAKEVFNRLGPIYGKGRFPIRSVFMLNCWGGSSLGQAFIDVGAKSVCGSRYLNYLFSRFTPFAKAWQNGETFDNALDASHQNDNRDKNLVAAGSAQKKKYWKKCKGYIDVLKDKGSCVRDYYQSMGTWRGEWLYDLNGEENMEFSSDFFMLGDPNMTKYKKPTW